MSYLLALILGFAFTVLFTPIALYLAKKFDFIDYPTRNHPAILQTKPLPRAGGLAMYAAFVLAVLILIHPFTVQLAVIIFAAGLNVLVGTLDDKYDLSPYIRLGTLALSAIIVILAGVTIPFITNPFAPIKDANWLIYLNQAAWTIPLPTACRLVDMSTCRLQIHPLADTFALLWIVWLINALNWSKGIGQLGGISAIAALTLGGTALMFTAGNPMQYITATLCFILAGCALGFTPFNFPPERQLPGFGASSFLGFMLAVLSILSGAKLAAAILVLGIPTIDGLITVVRRLAQKKLPIWGDRSHLYHKLLDLGFSKRQIILFYWIITATLGGLALLFSGKQKIYALLVIAVLLVALFLTISYLLTRQQRLTTKGAS